MCLGEEGEAVAALLRNLVLAEKTVLPGEVLLEKTAGGNLTDPLRWDRVPPPMNSIGSFE
jgi:hypothetical protein